MLNCLYIPFQEMFHVVVVAIPILCGAPVAAVTFGVRGLRELPLAPVPPRRVAELRSNNRSHPSQSLTYSYNVHVFPVWLRSIFWSCSSRSVTWSIWGQQLTSGIIFPSFPYPTPPHSPLFYFSGFQAQFWNSKFWSIFILFPVTVSKA